MDSLYAGVNSALLAYGESSRVLLLLLLAQIMLDRQCGCDRMHGSIGGSLDSLPSTLS